MGQVEFEVSNQVESAMKSQTAMLENTIERLKAANQIKEEDVERLRELAIEKEGRLGEATAAKRRLERVVKE